VSSIDDAAPRAGFWYRPADRSLQEETMSTIRFLSMLMLAAVVAGPARAVEQGASSLSFSLSPGRQLDQTYTVFSGRYGYYFAQDFEGSVALEAWRGKDPSLYKIAPELRYTFPMSPRAQPYGALFVTRTIYDGLPDRFTYGGRLGFFFTINRTSHLGVGLVHERIETCDSATYKACRQNYPEASLHFTF
jgi:hypothetical protein